MASQSQLTSQGLPQEARRDKNLLVGSEGQEFISCQLNENPKIDESVRLIQARGALPDPKVRPLLQFLDQLDLSRAQSFLGVLEASKKQLFAFMEHSPPEGLLDLLEASFPYISLHDLKEIPLAVLDRLNPVPANYLRQIAADHDLFGELPIGVQRQVWNIDKKLLQVHAMQQVAAYVNDHGARIRAIDMDQCLALAPDSNSGVQTQEATLLNFLVPRRILRRATPAIRKLVDMVGTSDRVYKGITSLLGQRLKDAQGLVMGMQEGALCALRSQLIMALHDVKSDTSSTSYFEIEQDPWYRLAWILDACIGDKNPDDKRLQSLKSLFSPYDRAPARQLSSAPPRKRHRVVGVDGGDAESQGVPGGGGSPDLAGAAMILRDPAALYLLCHQVLKKLRAVMQAEARPSDDDSLVFITRLLQLACSARTQLREHRFSFPAASHDTLSVVYPCLIDCLIDAEDRSDPSVVVPEEEVDLEQIKELVRLLTKDEVVRKITQSLALERLGLADLATAQVLLTALQQALAKISDKALAEWVPFAVTLARRMQRLVKAKHANAGHALWSLIFDRLLMRLVDTDVQVQEEMIWVLLAVANMRALSNAKVASYLQTMLHSTKRSRRRAMARQQEKAKAGQAVQDYDKGFASQDGGYNTGDPFDYQGYTTGGALSEGPRGGSAKGSDGVKHMYLHFVQEHAQLTPATAPDIFEYLGAEAEVPVS